MIKFLRPRLVTFDVTGTLLMTKLEHYVEIGSQHGLDVDPRILARSFKTNFHKLNEEHPIYGKHTGLGWENWWRTLVYNVFKEQHRYVSEPTLNKVANSLIRWYGTSRCWHKYPGTNEFLDYLQKRGLILGIISNFDERLEPILVDTSLRRYFSFVLTSYDLGMEKPNPSIFEEALRLTKERHGTVVTAREAIHIGDTHDRDYVGAKRAGWNAILINRDDGIVDDVPDADVYKSLPELRTHFDALLEERDSP
ncbi:hypothetical protein KM043_010757 [Ampulex compressa]|nr:hypothetical protein KM043_010757 [Ampulex compressa]